VVAHHLHLELLPAEEALLDQHLVTGEMSRPLATIWLELLAVVGDAAALPPSVKRAG
jgi:hypothetical protein